MTMIAGLPGFSKVILYLLLALVTVFSALVLVAQIGILRGNPFRNPDGTKDDWREQPVFYGIAWADILIACPLSFASVALVFWAPRPGFFLLGMVSFWFMWTNVMTTMTSLRFAKPRITAEWVVVFPLGAFIGLGVLLWILLHFSWVFGA